MEKRIDELGWMMKTYGATDEKVAGILSPAAKASRDHIHSLLVKQPTEARPVGAAPGAGSISPEGRASLKEGVETTFGNGQVWTLKGGQPVRIK
jgi:hypothetical protein